MKSSIILLALASFAAATNYGDDHNNGNNGHDDNHNDGDGNGGKGYGHKQTETVYKTVTEHKVKLLSGLLME